ncbi:hypothetical protein M011DRAFT_481090 [Sporormia fimetaria CBS 119925]|uniref:Uncharacterized protein n=1 Tax=Sporormia fimetaria CBS 119925 TaxID=1340428 RepID=A0A6A6V073_9PLEO|nr:hypothetical protein M011DRAFT_481090 [Sporormia fimetaria CBS 119925]
MPSYTRKRRLHPHLRGGIDFEDTVPPAEDLLEPLPEEQHDPVAKAAKRRRLENIATAYICRGQVPVFLTAHLQGPFDRGFKNPWHKGSKDHGAKADLRDGVQSADSSGISTEESESEDLRSQQEPKPMPQNPERFISDAQPANTASPHTRSRSAIITKDQHEHDVGYGRQHPDDRFPPSGPAPEWLKRRNFVERGSSELHSQEHSPTRSRHASKIEFTRRGHQRTLNASPQRSDIRAARFPGTLGIGSPLKSSGSAAMVLSSPYQPDVGAVDATANSNTPVAGPSASLATTRPQRQCEGEDPSVVMGSIPRIYTREQSADQIASKPRASQMRIEAPSSAFQFRKIDGRRGKKMKKVPEQQDGDEAYPQEDVPESVRATPGGRRARDGPQDAGYSPVDRMRDEEEVAIEQGRCADDRTSLGSSRHSLLSTQMAMRMAQLDFQDGTFPSPLPHSSDITEGDGVTQTFVLDPQATPTAKTGEKETIITPFHAFNAVLDKDCGDNEAAAPAISTQDLFLAASPFDFSTIKKQTKRSAMSKRSSLRFTVYSQGEGTSKRGDAASSKSSTCSSDRTPLKQRNSLAAMKTTSQKGSQESQALFSQTEVDELPRLDLPQSFNVNFADQFLGNLEETFE